MGKKIFMALGLFFVLVPLAASASDNPQEKILRFDTMVGVSGVFLGSANPAHPIRGINGGGLPWVLEEGRGELRKDGSLMIKVRGLIVPAEAGFGFNPVPFFRAAVSCITVEDSTVTEENVLTVPGDTKMLGDPRNGNALIKADLLLPDPCLAPVVFVTSPGGAWFSITGGTFLGN